MVQELTTIPNIFGRLGKGFGQGLAEQIPKEVERSRLASGLKQLGDQKGLSPFQQFASLAGIPGITPQMIQSGAELLRQQGIAQGFRNAGNEQAQNPLRAASQQGSENVDNQTPGLQSQPSGLVTPEVTQTALQPYIPKTRNQLLSRAADLYDQNRYLYPNPEMAMQAAIQEDQQNQSISNAQQAKRQSQIGVEERVRSQLSNLRQSANLQNIPENVFQKVENDVLDKVRAGIPELQASKEGQKTLDKIGREYTNLKGLGNWDFPLQDPNQASRSIKSSRNDFKKRDDLENFADTLVGVNGLTYPIGYQIAYPIEDKADLNKFVKDLPRVGKLIQKHIREKTQEIIPSLAKVMGNAKTQGVEGSPLSIGEEIASKGYDRDLWFDYLIKNKEALNLSQRQIRELGKPRSLYPSLNDMWFSIGNGQDKLLEQ